ncbi:cardiolipin synthetase [Zhengella mangrovi]|uniref:Phospholipase D n=1 Tax=Zhengella mangrovi TaxID=1982044 RepID=A0A2G1QQV9_9HYPH|nr:phospholipase D-like domain-containing protein [Zhengella mangrovi]PHP67906.1 cardiolipin synthetase [Zhengella mangrovi]
MTGLATHFGIVVVTLMAMAAAVMVLQQRRTPQSAVAWLLFIILVPWLALPIFLALGVRKRGARYAPLVFTPLAGPAERSNEAARLFERLGAPAALPGNRVTIVADPQAAWKALADMAEGATRRLDAMFYALDDDEAGARFLRLLIARREAGVRVRLVLDRFGAWRHPAGLLERLRASGGEIGYSSPFLHSPARGHINLRNHRKLFIADGRMALTGGRNVGDTYFGDGTSAPLWQDLSVQVEGPAVVPLADIFESDWAVVKRLARRASVRPDPVPSPDGAAGIVQIVPSGPDIPEDTLHDGLTVAIHEARRRVWLATPYFVPTEALGNALKLAARRGVDVRILVPEHSNQPMTDFARGAFLRELAGDGCRILRYPLAMVHAKAGLVDTMAWAGSANFDVRSMLLNFELAVLFHDPVNVKALEDWFAALEAGCETGMPPCGAIRRMAETVFRLGAPVL